MKTKNYTSAVEKTVFAMLKENTGIAMMDSGGDTGRNWQRNQGLTLAKLKASPSVTVDTDWGYKTAKTIAEISFTINVFHYLANQLELDEICDSFNRRNRNAKDWDHNAFYGVSKRAGEWLENLPCFELGRTVNTYNGESNLSQVLQYTHVKIGGECYVVLQTHGGADVRGGYTYARLFKLDNEYCYDGGMLNPEDVWGYVSRSTDPDYSINVDNRYSYCTRLTDENGNDFDFNPETDTIHLSLMEG